MPIGAAEIVVPENRNGGWPSHNILLKSETRVQELVRLTRFPIGNGNPAQDSNHANLGRSISVKAISRHCKLRGIPKDQPTLAGTD